MAGDAITKVLDVECALESTRKEAAKGCYEASECRHDKGMQLECSVWQLVDHEAVPSQRLPDWRDEVRERLSDCRRERPCLPQEDMVRFTPVGSKRVHAKRDSGTDLRMKA